MGISAIGQTYVADTLIADLQKDSLLSFNHTLRVSDKRDAHPNFISIYEKKKWLFFPVDQVVLTAQPLAKGFEQQLSGRSSDLYALDIHEFYIKHSESTFKRTLRLDGAFELSKIEPAGDSILLGVFYYGTNVSYKKKGQSIELAYSDILTQFKKEFIYDLNIVSSDTLKNYKKGEYHFRKGASIAPKNFYVSTDVYYGYTFWGFDAEIWFSSPEPSQKFNRKSRMFRYLNYGNRQSVAFSTGVSQLNYRVNEKWLFTNKRAFLIGFNKWNDVDEEMRTLEEMFLFQFSMTQRICYNKLDKSGLVFGVGFIEEASYIIYNTPMVNFGVVLSCAYKF